ncbi:MAG TPA: hypothetical protein VNG33_17090 [Polyangiaceae bacterium]|nr:hypothetical protein [Polyangiaceae bacterium]
MARAEEPAVAPAATAPATAAKDVVRLKNGGLLRGTIAELVPEDSVTIVTVAGKTRTFQMKEVDYAGPADRDPSATAPAPTPAPPPTDAPAFAPTPAPVKPYVTVNGQEAHLHFVSEPPGLTFHRQTSAAVLVNSHGRIRAEGYERLCTAPCSINIPAGTEKLALSEADGEPVPATSVTFPSGESTLKGNIESNQGVRSGGIVVMLIGAVAGSVAVYASIGSHQDCSGYVGCDTKSDVNLPLMALGMGVLGVGGLVGVLMLMTPDESHVEMQDAARERGLGLPRAVGFGFSGQL